MAYTFRGGIHPEYNKEDTCRLAVEELDVPTLMYFPMSQHVGAPCDPIVNVGDRVLMGQRIGDTNAPVSSPVFSSVSGIVKAIEQHPHPQGLKATTVVVENDHLDQIYPGLFATDKPIPELTPEDVMALARAAGIVGMGGAGFPAHIKNKSAAGLVDTLIINGSECEPYLTSDHRLMLEYAEHIIGGVRILMTCLGVKRTFMAIENNKLDAIERMSQLLHGDKSIKVAVLKTKYPQGGEKQLIKAITDREVPPGKLPVDVKCSVFNVDTCASLYRAYKTGMPVFRRIVTVTGSAIARRRNLYVRIGTPIQFVIDACGGFARDPHKVIMGGPMMGVALYTLECPVVKTTNALLCFTEREMQDAPHPSCIRCGRCIKACPMNLMPVYLAMYGERDLLDDCEKLNVRDCIECGSCAYICPGRLYLVQNLRTTKLMLQNRDRKTAAQAGR